MVGSYAGMRMPLGVSLRPSFALPFAYRLQREAKTLG